MVNPAEKTLPRSRRKRHDHQSTGRHHCKRSIYRTGYYRYVLRKPEGSCFKRRQRRKRKPALRHPYHAGSKICPAGQTRYWTRSHSGVKSNCRCRISRIPKCRKIHLIITGYQCKTGNCQLSLYYFKSSSGSSRSAGHRWFCYGRYSRTYWGCIGRSWTWPWVFASHRAYPVYWSTW